MQTTADEADGKRSLAGEAKKKEKKQREAENAIREITDEGGLLATRRG